MGLSVTTLSRWLGLGSAGILEVVSIILCGHSYVWLAASTLTFSYCTYHDLYINSQRLSVDRFCTQLALTSRMLRRRLMRMCRRFDNPPFCLWKQQIRTKSLQGKTMYFSNRFGIAARRFLLSSHLAEKSRSAYRYAPSQRTVTTV
jgi:hypothetical protein